MKTTGILMILISLILLSCKDDDQDVSEKFVLLTTPVWESESLLVNGVDASGPGGMLENFKGDAEFNEDGTGYFGEYTGTWQFSEDETQLIITAVGLPFPIVAVILELTASSLKIRTEFPNPPQDNLIIDMAFRAK
jgi:hypothetical protein